MSEKDLLSRIADSYVLSAHRDDFNGLVAAALLKIQPAPEKLRTDLSSLVRARAITAVFSRLVLNIHIKRLPDMPVERQVELLESEDLDEIALYPTAAIIGGLVDLSEWQDRPFSKALLLAEPQLSYRAFELGALERYISDPRYIVHFDDYMGTMSVSDASFADEEYPERDKIALQTFGLGFDERRNPFIIVFLRYLAGLSPEHQQYWNSFLAAGHVRMSEPYFRSSIEGDFWENHSVRHAILEEMRLIRNLTEAIWGRSLFRPLPEREIPIGLTSFLRPTAENFNRFVMSLDKLLSESIDLKFFEGKADLEVESVRGDGKVIVQKKGSLTLLEEWLSATIVWEDLDEFRKVVIQPLRNIRRLRQKPAHTFSKNSFSQQYQDDRKRILWSVLNSLSNIRATFSKHPLAREIEIPKDFDDRFIDVF